MIHKEIEKERYIKRKRKNDILRDRERLIYKENKRCRKKYV